jgi:hypothetical protein
MVTLATGIDDDVHGVEDVELDTVLASINVVTTAVLMTSAGATTSTGDGADATFAGDSTTTTVDVITALPPGEVGLRIRHSWGVDADAGAGTGVAAAADG